MDVDDLLKTVKNALVELATIEVVTTVGPANITVDAEKHVNFDVQSPPMTSAITRINITGDIFTNRTPDLVTGEFTAVSTYHDAMVDKAQGIVKDNLNFMLDAIAKLQKL